MEQVKADLMLARKELKRVEQSVPKEDEAADVNEDDIDVDENEKK
jgi:hypothetical protein